MIHHISTSSPSPPGLDSTKISQVWTPLTRLSSQNRLPTSRADQGFYFLFLQNYRTDWWNCDFIRIDPKFVNNPELSDIQVRPITNLGKIVFSSKNFKTQTIPSKYIQNTTEIPSKCFQNTNTINPILNPFISSSESRDACSMRTSLSSSPPPSSSGELWWCRLWWWTVSYDDIIEMQ